LQSPRSTPPNRNRPNAASLCNGGAEHESGSNKNKKAHTNPGVWDETSAIRRLTGENVYAKDMVDHRQL
jgi:hypothetical protein